MAKAKSKATGALFFRDKRGVKHDADLHEGILTGKKYDKSAPHKAAIERLMNRYKIVRKVAQKLVG